MTIDAQPQTLSLDKGAALPESLFTYATYTVRRKVLKIFGGAFYLLDDSGNMIGYSKQAAFKWKEDIRVYTNTDMTTELLVIKARSVIDFGATYDVFDPRNAGRAVGSLRRKGWKSSFLRDEWSVFTADGAEFGMIQEDSGGLALLRRFLGAVVQLISPQAYHVTAGEAPVAHYQTNRNPFVYKLGVTTAPEAGKYMDPRLILAGAILITAIEGRQE